MAKFTVEFLGTGTSQGVPVIQCDCDVCQSEDPYDNRLRCSIAVSTGDKTLIVDVGPDFRQQMLRTNYKSVDEVLITHEHNDHVIGLDDLRPYNFRQKADIPIRALSRVGEELKAKFHYAFTENKYPGAPAYDMFTLSTGDSWEWEGIKITAFEIMHGNLPILGFRFDDFVYITDAKTIPHDSLQYLENIECLTINALQEEQHWSHLTLSEARELSFGLKPKRTYFTHISHRLGKHSVMQEKLSDTQFFAYDGLVLSF